MDPKQLELDFDTSMPQPQPAPTTARVLEFAAFVRSRREQRTEDERSQLLAAIVSSVDHIRGSDPEAEAL